MKVLGGAIIEYCTLHLDNYQTLFARLVSSSPSVLCRTRPGSLVLVSRYSSGMASYSRWISSMLVWRAGAGAGAGRAGWNTCSRAATALLAADTVAASSSETAAARTRASAESSSSSRRSVSSS